MKSTRVCWLAVTFLLVTCAGIAAWLDRWFMCWPGNRAETFNPLHVFIGDGQKMFAGTFYRKADVYFHSGYYPTIYDNRESVQTLHIAEDAGAVASKNTGGDELAFLGPPRDWIDRFSRKMFPAVHTELNSGGANGTEDAGAVREILPWLKLAAVLDPEAPETYTVTAFWLRRQIGKEREAELFLREGLRNVPGNPEILFELGQIYFEDHKDTARARNIWRQALVEWQKQEGAKPEPDRFIFAQLHGHLAQLEEQAGNLSDAIAHWEQLQSASPASVTIQARIAELRKKQAALQPAK